MFGSLLKFVQDAICQDRFAKSISFIAIVRIVIAGTRHFNTKAIASFHISTIAE
jgi:hypothetical protein